MNYIFRPPAKAYGIEFNFEGLKKYAEAGRSGYFRMLGTTLKLTLAGDDSNGVMTDCIIVTLYDTQIAYLYSDGRVRISDLIDQHGSQATTYWIQKILLHNKIPGIVARHKGKYPQAGKTFERGAR